MVRDSRFFRLDKMVEGGVLKRLFPRVMPWKLTKNFSEFKVKGAKLSLLPSEEMRGSRLLNSKQIDLSAEIIENNLRWDASFVDRLHMVVEMMLISVASIRKTLDDNRFQEESLSTRWVKSVPIKVNILAWKVKSNALPTRFNISRRGMDIDSICCPIC
ncbi:RNA-directed DNA polymerase, eukaryota [Tanacetum coccineum]